MLKTKHELKDNFLKDFLRKLELYKEGEDLPKKLHKLSSINSKKFSQVPLSKIFAAVESDYLLNFCLMYTIPGVSSDYGTQTPAEFYDPELMGVIKHEHKLNAQKQKKVWLRNEELCIRCYDQLKSLSNLDQKSPTKQFSSFKNKIEKGSTLMEKRGGDHQCKLDPLFIDTEHSYHSKYDCYKRGHIKTDVSNAEPPFNLDEFDLGKRKAINSKDNYKISSSLMSPTKSTMQKCSEKIGNKILGRLEDKPKWIVPTTVSPTKKKQGNIIE